MQNEPDLNDGIKRYIKGGILDLVGYLKDNPDGLEYLKTLNLKPVNTKKW